MEYMRLDGFLGAAVSKLVNKAVEAKVGFKPGINIEGMEVVGDDTQNKVLVRAELSMSQEQFNKFIEEVTK